MKEQIYTIPVNDAFDSDCECPICSMYKRLEDDAVEYTMGPSYMEDDIRAKTDRMGFCQKHLKKVYDQNNRLGFAWVMKTHLDKVIYEVEKASAEPVKGKTLFKKAEQSPVSAYIQELNSSCYVCDKVNTTFERYVDTIFYMYKKDGEFRKKFEASKGFCTTHYEVLIREAGNRLSGDEFSTFVGLVNKLYLDNVKRVRDDVEWFINKFDHKYADEPWKNAKDSLTRAMIKDGSYLE